MKLILKKQGPRLIRYSVVDKNVFLWDWLRNLFAESESRGLDAFTVQFHEFLSTWKDVYGHLSRYDVDFDVDTALIEDVKRFREQRDIARNFTPKELEDRLTEAGFKRKLKDFQAENVCKLTRKNQGATFSVPGAGKTTEALAFFYATARPEDKLLVVAPLNAFGAWDEQLTECTGNRNLSFVRLTGGADNVARVLRENHQFLLTNYELLRSPQPREKIYLFLRGDPNVYVFLDESHKIKNEATAQAEAIRLIQPFPKAKLIMSGTPMPQSPKDLLPQYRFLFPDESVSEDDVVSKFQHVYVRTTAHRLGIPDIRTHRCNIELDELEKTLYWKMRKLTLKNAGTPSADARYLRNLGKSVMRLLAFVSNPSLIANLFSSAMPELSEYLRTRDSKKIEYVCKRARQLVAKGKKVLIWSSFVRNVELISSRLQDLGADYIHGGVKAGDPADPTSREGKLRKFNAPGSSHKVLVANPAAASEGISLHKACQYAIYLDRSFNAAQFLQSQDRIHRLDMPVGTIPEMEFVMCPNTIDDVVETRLLSKIKVMSDALNDKSIVPSDPELLYDTDEEDGPEVDDTKSGISRTDVEAILRHLQSC